VPEKKEDRQLLYLEFTSFMSESFKLFNAEEVAYAMRKYGTGIKDWGKSLNLSLVREALDEYQEERLRASRIEEQEKTKPLQLTSPVLEEISMNEWVETSRNAFLSGLVSIELLPVDVYSFLEKEGLIKLDNAKKKLMKESVSKMVEARIKTDIEFAKYIKTIDQEQYIRNLCKKHALAEYFENTRETK